MDIRLTDRDGDGSIEEALYELHGDGVVLVSEEFGIYFLRQHRECWVFLEPDNPDRRVAFASVTIDVLQREITMLQSLVPYAYSKKKIALVFA
ncbi:MAG: hypothetical protein KA731_04055 [Candidatus Moranbacteria bacterium]|nr:hypothetical protein [Candidatus Moranbacteria bacterium]